MKLYRTSYSMAKIAYFPLMGLFILLSLTAYRQYSIVYLVHWIFLLMLMILLILPARQQAFGERHVTWPRLLLYILSLVSLLMLYFYVSSAFLSQQLPINQPSIAPVSSGFLLSQGGLYPWAIVALLAITLQKLCLIDHQPGLISSLLQRSLGISEHDDVGKIINVYIRHAVLFSLMMPITFIWLAVLHLGNTYFDLHIPTGINMITLPVTTLLFWMLGLSRWLRCLNWLLEHRVPALLSILLTTFSLVLVFAIASYLLMIAYSAIAFPLMEYPFFNTNAWPLLWQTYHTFLQFCWVPFASAVIATVSRGYRIWQITLVTFAVPLISLIVMPTHLHIPSSHSAWLVDSLLIVICITLLLVSFRKKYLTNLLRGTLPFPHEIKQRNT
ncbi:MAG: BCCT family transporter, partial [Pseudomonadota bacterium]|nr:BCCT family transporter [Pseudomonadota bacterium]